MKIDYKNLIKKALEARENSYSPYSNFRVGACALCENGKTYLGTNIENASFGLTNCAERTAIFSAVASGERNFKAIAIVASDENYCYPCGACRQVIAQFMKDAEIICAKTVDDYKIYKINDLLPNSFEF